MNWMTYYLCKNPSIKHRIVNELEEMFPDNKTGNTNVPYTQLQHLSLLEHAEIECLRLHPPIGYSMPRDTPPSGAVISGVYIPGGVAVGVPPAIIGRNSTVYPDPDTWNPERWSTTTTTGGGGAGSEDLARMKTCFLGFGYGSRQCIGRGVANQFVGKMMGRLLLRYEVRLEEEGLVLGTKEFTILKPDRSYNVVLRRREG
jgi:cytochrome P450